MIIILLVLNIYLKVDFLNKQTDLSTKYLTVFIIYKFEIKYINIFNFILSIFIKFKL